MRIAGFVPNSFVDYPGKIAMLVFTPGCNMNCWYCHNRHLIRAGATDVYYNPASILADLDKKRGFIDAVVISGGEPTLHRGVAEFAAQVKERGFLVKLDTNGTNPALVRGMLRAGTLDYVAMDVKAPFAKYEAVCCRAVDTAAVRETIALLAQYAAQDSGFTYELRTTFSPDLTGEDVLRLAGEACGIAQEASGAAVPLYTLQQYRPTPHTEDRPAHAPEYVRETAAALGQILPRVRVLGV